VSGANAVNNGRIQSVVDEKALTKRRRAVIKAGKDDYTLSHVCSHGERSALNKQKTKKWLLPRTPLPTFELEALSPSAGIR